MTCPLCEEAIAEDDHDVVAMGYLSGRTVPAHRACILRSVAGGWGHHIDHERWCVQEHDPDGGLSYRESALRVAALFAAEGSVG